MSDKDTKQSKDKPKQIENVDRCVCCGEIIPEGRQTCPVCQAKMNLAMWDA